MEFAAIDTCESIVSRREIDGISTANHSIYSSCSLIEKIILHLQQLKIKRKTVAYNDDHLESYDKGVNIKHFCY